MEKDEFATRKQALALKELGFNEHCLATWEKDIKYPQRWDWDFELRNSTNQEDEVECTAPLKQQVFRWFREKYKIQGYIYSSTVRGNTEGTKQFTGYVWNINGIDKPFISTDARDELHDTYDEAEDACIDKLIEIFKQQTNDKD
jgi:hypothetical protein